MASKLISGCLLSIALLGCLGMVPPKPQHPQKLQQPQHRQHTQNPRPHKKTDQVNICDVEQQAKIQCGVPGTSASECEALHCCFDGQMCYYGNSVTLHCTKDGQFIVVVARDTTLPNIDLDSISFLGSGETCSAVGVTSAFVIYQFPVSSCGTILTEEPGVLIYENRLFSSYEVAIGPYGSITRDSHFNLVIQCRYTGASVEAVVIEVKVVPSPLPVAAIGPLNVELRLGNGLCEGKGCVEEDVAYTSYYVDTDYPVTKVLRDPVYVEVRMLGRTDPNLVLTLGRCWATCNPYLYSYPQWDLINEGCPYSDDHYQTKVVNVGPSMEVLFPTHYRRFIFKMFTFVSTDGADPGKGNKGIKNTGVFTPLNEKVYIHCHVAVCQPSLGNNCEPLCNRKRRDIGGSTRTQSRPEGTTVSSLEIHYIDSN